jgi:hypothetical protein
MACFSCDQPEGEICMSSRLSPSLTNFAEGRWPDDRGMAQRQMYPRELDRREVDLRELDRNLEPPLHPSELDRFEREPSSVSRWVPVAFVRFMIFFFVGVAMTLAWQSYGNAARRIVASLTPGLSWLAPPPVAPSAPGASASGPAASPDQLAAVSRSLAAVRQSVDKLAADVTKLQAAKPDPAPARTSGPPASLPPPATTAATQARKPAVAQAASTR